jgi:hypothetical protein
MFKVGGVYRAPTVTRAGLSSPVKAPLQWSKRYPSLPTAVRVTSVGSVYPSDGWAGLMVTVPLSSGMLTTASLYPHFGQAAWVGLANAIIARDIIRVSTSQVETILDSLSLVMFLWLHRLNHRVALHILICQNAVPVHVVSGTSPPSKNAKAENT